MFFTDIPAKDREKQYLIRQAQENKVPHAQLFLGKEGFGGLALARAFASYLLCTNKSESDSCGKCKSCNLSHKLVHPDLHFAFPVVKKDGLKREDTFSDNFIGQFRSLMIENAFATELQWSQSMGSTTKANINVKECQEIANKLSLRAFGDGPKILILWLPEYLGKEGNRLLKLIEEPTDDTFIILVTENPQLILPTILSRCQVLRIDGFQDDEVSAWIEKSFTNLTSTYCNQIARLSNGNLGKAIIMANEEGSNYAEFILDWLRCAYKGDAVDMLQMSEKLGALPNDRQIEFLEYGLMFLREYLFWTNTGSIPRLSDQEIASAHKLSSILGIHQVEALIEVFDQTIFALNRNGNQKIVFMANTIIMGDILKNRMNNSLRMLTL